jgi:predicted aldo/keto reductase-like oxidoreductase
MNVIEHIDENLRIASEALPNSLTEKELEIMDTVKKAYSERTKVNCTGCQYCMPCPAGVNIPKNFAEYNKYHMIATAETGMELKFLYNAFIDVSQRPEQCVECGKCESHCPQGIKIRQELKNVKALFELKA